MNNCGFIFLHFTMQKNVNKNTKIARNKIHKNIKNIFHSAIFPTDTSHPVGCKNIEKHWISNDHLSF